MKIIAKQVPSEYQESPLSYAGDLGIVWPGVIFHGNRHFNSHTTPEFDAIYERFDGEKKILRALHLVTGKRWEKKTLRGYCQGDWQDIYYPAADYTAEDLKLLEIEYFNMGSEWIIETEEEPEGFSMYCYGDSPEAIRAEIAALEGVKPEEVKIFEFDGWTRTAKYKEVL